MKKRLSSPTGEIVDKKKENDQLDRVVREAILVHSAPNGEKAIFYSSDGEVFFDDARVQNIVNVNNQKVNTLAKDYGGFNQMPIGAFPPILDQHEDDSNDRVVGRLATQFRYEVRNVPGVGENCSCVIADITFLGEDTVKKVNDGRIYHLSVGIDDDTDLLSETSVVIEPAAPGAMLLKKGKNNMSKRLEANKKKLTKLAEMKSSLTKMVNKVDSANVALKTTRKKNEVTHRLMSLVRAGKMMPSEYKKQNIKELSSLDDKSLKIALNVFESREKPVIQVGQIGSRNSVDFSSIGKALGDKKMKNLKAEVMGDMKKLSGKKKLFSEDKEKELEAAMDEKKELSEEVSVEKDPHAVPGEMQLSHAHLSYMAEMKKHLDSGDLNAAHMCHMKHLEEMKSMGDVQEVEGENGEKRLELGDVQSEDYKKEGDDLQSQIDELNTQLARIAGMVDELIDVEKAEGQEMVEEGEKHENLSGEFAGDNTKELEDDKKKEEEKKLAEDKAKEDEEKKLKKLEEDKKKEEDEKKLEADKKAKEEIEKDLKKK